jgi:DnaJ-class molecular chaperone
MVVKQYHPDTAPAEPVKEKFMEAREAYETLSDETKRSHYDREMERHSRGARLQSKPAASGGPGKSPPQDTDRFTSAADEFFAGFIPGFLPDFFEKGRGRGKDLYLEVILSPREAQDGGLFPVRVPVFEPCPRCGKSGIWEDFFCPVCSGTGRIPANREFSLSIPPHVRHGTEIRLSLEDIGLPEVSVHVTVLIDHARDYMAW